ncbi:MAG: PrsW family intramembrane metalloprotease [Thermoplasmata archaeon]|nr:PrsW family intramembrane metalloprotease [Thermoplasmata archaeon]
MSRILDIARIYVLVVGALFVLTGTFLVYVFLLGEIDLPLHIILMAFALLYAMGFGLIYAIDMPGHYYVWRTFPNPYYRGRMYPWNVDEGPGPDDRGMPHPMPGASRPGPYRGDDREPWGRVRGYGRYRYDSWLYAPYYHMWERHSKDERTPDNQWDLPDPYTLLAVFVFSIAAGSTILLFARSNPMLYLGFPLAFMIAFSFPSLIWISYVYEKEYTPEPRRGMLLALTWGMLSTNLAIVMEGAVGTISIFALAVIVAPVVEELVKPLGLLFLRRWITDPLRGLVYGVTCGMGFAMVENLLYEAFFLNQDLQTAANPVLWGSGSLMRGLLSTMGHAVGTGLIGYAYGLHRHRLLTGRDLDWYRAPHFAAMAVAIAIGLHASWNGSAYLAEEVHPGLISVALFVASVELYFLLLLTRRAVRVSRRTRPSIGHASHGQR